jgi:CDP-diacylglycerol--serine O-phosphatidyltransferase
VDQVRIPVAAIKTVVVRLKPDWILPTLIGVGLLVAALSSAPWHTLLAVGVVYLVSLPIGWWSAWRLRRRDQAERAAQASAPPADSPPQIVSLGGRRGTGSEGA